MPTAGASGAAECLAARASVESSEHGFGRVRNDGKERARRSARHPLALLPVPDGFNGDAQPRREFDLGQTRPPTQASDLGFCIRR